jgi:hypothetical protein
MTAFFGLAVLFPPFVILGIVAYLGPPVYRYVTDSSSQILIDLVPTVGGSDTPPDTRGMRNAEVRFNDKKATVHASIDVDSTCERYCLRFETPDPPIEVELRGAAVAEQTFEAPNVLRCDDIRTYGFDPVIDMYVDDLSDLDRGDYMLRVYEEYEDELLAEIRLVSS